MLFAKLFLQVNGFFGCMHSSVRCMAWLVSFLMHEQFQSNWTVSLRILIVLQKLNFFIFSFFCEALIKEILFNLTTRTEQVYQNIIDSEMHSIGTIYSPDILFKRRIASHRCFCLNSAMESSIYHLVRNDFNKKNSIMILWFFPLLNCKSIIYSLAPQKWKIISITIQHP